MAFQSNAFQNDSFQVTAGGADVSVGITTVTATGFVGTLEPSSTTALTTITATGFVGTLEPSSTTALTGNSATLIAGSVTYTGDASAYITGVQAAGEVGSVVPPAPPAPPYVVEYGANTIHGGGGASSGEPIDITDYTWQSINALFKKGGTDQHAAILRAEDEAIIAAIVNTVLEETV